MPSLEQVITAARSVWPEPHNVSVQQNKTKHVSSDHSQETTPTGNRLLVSDGIGKQIVRTKNLSPDELMEFIEGHRKKKAKEHG